MLIRLTVPQGDAVDFDDLKEAVRAPASTVDDSRLRRILAAEARRYEDFTGRYLRPVSLEARFGCWASELVLPAWPVRQVTAVAYLDALHAEQTLSGSAWYLREGNGVMRLLFTDSSTLPDLSDRPDAVRVRFEAGSSAELASGESADLESHPADALNVMRMVDRAYNTDKEIDEAEMRSTMGNRRIFR